MTSKHPIACVAISAAVALKLFAGTADIVNQATGWTGRPIIVTDISNPTPQVQLGRGLDIARVDGEIVNS
jgi:hypothetical protein